MMKFIKDENGQGMLEYVLIIALVALVLIGAIVLIKNYLEDSDTKGDIKNKLEDAGLSTTAHS